MSRSLVRWVTAAAIAGISFSEPSNAVPLVSAVLEESANGSVGGGLVSETGAGDGPEAVSLDLAGAGGSYHGVAWTSAGSLGRGSAWVSASGTGADRALFGNGSANVLLSYEFAVEEIVPSCGTPPCPAVYAPITLQAHGVASAFGSGGVPDPFALAGYAAGARSQIYFSANGGVPALLASAVAASATGIPAAQFDFVDTFDVRVNQAHSIQLNAFAFVNRSVGSEPGHGTASAFVDPVITLDPAWADDYRLVVSEGISVPEPSIALALAAGLGAVVVMNAVGAAGVRLRMRVR